MTNHAVQVSVGDAAGGWIAYTILLIQGLVYLAFLLMLVCKIGEGLVRFFGDVSFDRSKHTVDTGLIGAIGLAGCCGSGRRRRRRGRRGSDATSQNMLPAVMQTATSRTSVSGPTSVLRPEQLNQPYREESDDEGGYILGAWHYEDEEPAAAAPVAATATTGFSRVAGGRANMESPYTIEAGTTSGESAAGGSGLYLPPGAMAPGRVAPAREPAIMAGEAPGGGGQGAAVRRGWNPFRRRDEGGRSERSGGDALAEEPGVAAAPGTFVVIRERRPSPLSQAHGVDPAGGTPSSVRANSTQGAPAPAGSASSPPDTPHRAPNRRRDVAF